MHLFDLHCDTLYKVVTENKTLFEPQPIHLSIERGMKFSKWYQFFAIWIPDRLKGNEALNLFLKGAELFYKQTQNIKNTNNYKFFLTVENASMLNGDIKNIEFLKKYNVKAVTLTWNGKNSLGDGAEIENPKGITRFGKQVVKELEKNKIIVDISHASQKLFYDVAQIAGMPFIATHSNAYSVTQHKRNLTDDMFNVIKERKGIVGINFYPNFLNNKNEKASVADIIKHTEHFLSLGGEKNICLGSDFDGADMPKGIKGIESMGYIYEAFLKENYSEALVKDIFFENALNFMKSFDFLENI